MLGLFVELAQFGAQQPHAGHQQADDAAGGAEQRRDADGEILRIVIGGLGGAAGQEAERHAERHRGDHASPDDQLEDPAYRNTRTLLAALDAAFTVGGSLHVRRLCPSTHLKRVGRKAGFPILPDALLRQAGPGRLRVRESCAICR
jgi:hypothetical protein